MKQGTCLFVWSCSYSHAWYNIRQCLIWSSHYHSWLFSVLNAHTHTLNIHTHRHTLNARTHNLSASSFSCGIWWVMLLSSWCCYWYVGFAQATGASTAPSSGRFHWCALNLDVGFLGSSCRGPWSHPLLDLGRHGHEGLFHVRGALCARLEERDGQRVCKLLRDGNQQQIHLREQFEVGWELTHNIVIMARNVIKFV